MNFQSPKKLVRTRFADFFDVLRKWKDDGVEDNMMVAYQHLLDFEHWLWKSLSWSELRLQCWFFPSIKRKKKRKSCKKSVLFKAENETLKYAENEAKKTNASSSMCSEFLRGDPGWLELLKTYDGKFCLKFFSSTAVRSDSGQVWLRSGLTAVKLDSCQRTPAVYMNFNSLVRHDFLQLNSLTSFFHFLIRKSLPKNEL